MFTGVKTWVTSGLVTNIFITARTNYAVFVFKELRKKVGGLTRITGGLSTRTTITQFDDLTQWQAFSLIVRELSRLTWSDLFILETEFSIKPFTQGTQEIDFDKLKECLKTLPPDLCYVWWYANVGQGDPLFSKYSRLIETVIESLPRVIFIDRRYSSPSFVNANGYRAGGMNTELLLRKHHKFILNAPLLWFYGDQAPYWKDNQIKEALALVKEDEWPIIYTGSERWAEASRSIPIAYFTP